MNNNYWINWTLLLINFNVKFMMTSFEIKERCYGIDKSEFFTILCLSALEYNYWNHVHIRQSEQCLDTTCKHKLLSCYGLVWLNTTNDCDIIFWFFTNPWFAYPWNIPIVYPIPWCHLESSDSKTINYY